MHKTKLDTAFTRSTTKSRREASPPRYAFTSTGWREGKDKEGKEIAIPVTATFKHDAEGKLKKLLKRKHFRNSPTGLAVMEKLNER